LIAPALWGFLASLFLLNATFAATWNFLALRIAGLGGGAFLIAVAASLQAVGEIPAMAYTARLTALLSHRGVYVAGCAVYLGVFVSWAVIDDPLALSLIKLVIGVGFAFTYVGAVVIVDDLVPDQLRATGQGLAKAVSFGLAPVLGTLGGGLVYDVLGPAPMFLSAAALAGVAAAIAWLVVREARPSTVAVSAEP
jgi:PPP family 3-phenylpropionic acid transporter